MVTLLFHFQSVITMLKKWTKFETNLVLVLSVGKPDSQGPGSHSPRRSVHGPRKLGMRVQRLCYHVLANNQSGLCCDFSHTFTVTIPSLPFLKLRGIFAYFSFWNSLSERGMMILPLSKELLLKLDGWKSPVVVDVQSVWYLRCAFRHISFALILFAVSLLNQNYLRFSKFFQYLKRANLCAFEFRKTKFDTRYFFMWG